MLSKFQTEGETKAGSDSDGLRGHEEPASASFCVGASMSDLEWWCICIAGTVLLVVMEFVK